MRQTPESRKASLLKYNKSDKRRATSARYRATEKGKATDRKHTIKSNLSPQKRAYQKLHEQRPHIKAMRKAYMLRPENKEANYIRSLKRFYKMDYETYKLLFEKQKGLCAICSEKPNYRLAVDHNHTTGNVRGLLCRKCNLGIGFLRDNKDILQKAIDYLI